MFDACAASKGATISALIELVDKRSSPLTWAAHLPESNISFSEREANPQPSESLPTTFGLLIRAMLRRERSIRLKPSSILAGGDGHGLSATTEMDLTPISFHRASRFAASQSLFTMILGPVLNFRHTLLVSPRLLCPARRSQQFADLLQRVADQQG